jgi:beta-xylosidase
MEPLEWTANGWPRVPEKIRTDQPIKKPVSSERQPDRRNRLGEFRIGFDWKFYKNYDISRFIVENNVLTLKAQGDSPYTSSPMMFVAGHHAYEIEVEIETEPNTTAGIVLYYNDHFLVGSGFNSGNRYSYRSDGPARRGTHKDVSRLWLRLRNNHHIVTGTYSFDGINWEKDDWGMEVSGYNHNTLQGFQSLLPGIFVCGEGMAKFKNFKYTVLD